MIFIVVFSLLSQVDSEWVEIAQNNYRRNTLKKVSVKADFTTESYNYYPNLTLSAPDWHKGHVNRVVNVGSMGRVPFATVRTQTLTPNYTTHIPKHEITEAMETNANGVSNKQEYYDIDMAHLRKVTKLNTENVNSNKHDKPDITANLNGFTTIDKDEELTYLDKNERISFSTKPTLVKDQIEIGYSDKANMKFTSDSSNSMVVNNINKSKDKIDHHLQQTRIETEYEPSKNNKKHYNKTPILSSSMENDIKVNKPVKLENKNKINLDVHLLNKIVQNLIETLNKPNEELLNTSITYLNKAKDLEIGIKNTLTKTEISEESLNSQESEVPKIKLETTKEDYLDGMWKMFKIITDIISKNTQKSVKSKIKYLENLRNNILYSIEDRINRAWPDDQNSQEHNRATRSAHARGHVELPSSEGALMTISFLTFAVFLIKLVLQIIHTYKNKTMMMTPAVVTAVGRAAAAFRTRK